MLNAGQNSLLTKLNLLFTGGISFIAPSFSTRAFTASGIRSGLRMAHIFAILPLLDIIIGQFHAAYNIFLGPVSVAQAYHVIVLLFLGVVVFSKLRSFPSQYRYILWAASAMVGSLVLSSACLLAEGKLTFESMVANSQIIYWLVFFLGVFISCKNSRDGRMILHGILLAGIYATLTVVYLYLTKGSSASIYEELSGNAAGMNTAKGLTGILVTAALIAIWLYRDRMKWFGVMVFLACICGLLLTYQRAGLVGTGFACVWLALWQMFPKRGGKKSKWAIRPICIGLLAAIIVFSAVGTDGLEKRWDDLSNPEKAGSGRAKFWQVAFDYYGDMDGVYQLSGIGYTQTTNALASRYGARIHTHSDILDILLMFGVIGLAALVVWHAAILKTIAGTSRSDAFAILIAIYLLMLCQGVFTGQILCPSVMACYLSAIACVLVMERCKQKAES